MKEGLQNLIPPHLNLSFLLPTSVFIPHAYHLPISLFFPLLFSLKQLHFHNYCFEKKRDKMQYCICTMCFVCLLCLLVCLKSDIYIYMTSMSKTIYTPNAGLNYLYMENKTSNEKAYLWKKRRYLQKMEEPFFKMEGY